MATDHNFKVKNGLSVGNTEIIDSLGNIGAGGAADSSYDLKVHGLARFEGTSNFIGNLQVGGFTVITSARNMQNIGNINIGGYYAMDGVTIIDTSKNLTNIGTISSGAINASGPVSITGNGSYVGNFGYNTLVLQDTSGYPGINFRHGNRNWLVRKNGNDDDLEFVYSDNASAQGTGTYSQILTIRDSGGVNFHGGSLENVGSIASGVITATGEGHTFYSSSNSIKFGRNANENIQIIVTDGTNKIVATQDSDADSGHDFILDRIFNASAGSSNFYIRNAGSNQLSIDKNANVTIAGNLTVQGTTTTIDTANLNVEDNNITLNYSTGDSSGSADGAGITIQDAVNGTTDAFMNWNATHDIFQFSHSATFGYTTIDPDLFLGTAGGFGNISDGSGWSARGLYIHGGATGDAAAIGHNGAGLYFGIQNNSTGNSMSTWLNVTPTKDATFSANLSVTGDLKMIGTDSYIWTPSTSDGYTGFFDPNSGDIALRWENDVRGWGIAGVPESGYKLKVHGDTRTTGAAIFGEQISIGTTDTSSGHVVDARESRDGNSLMRLWNTNTGSSAVSAIRAASSGSGAEARRFELSDNAGYLTSLAADNTNGFRLRHGASNSSGPIANPIRFGILNSGDSYFTEQLRIRASSYAPLSNLFEGTLVVEGSSDEDPIITKTDSGTTGAAAGVFHQSSASPTFPAFVVNTAASSGTNKLLSLRTGVSNSTGTGGTEKFSVDNDGRTWSRNTVVVGDVTTLNSGFVGVDETDAFILADGTKARQYILTDSNDGGAWHQWVRYRNGVNTWRIGTYDTGYQTGFSAWRLGGVNRTGGAEVNYIVAGPRAGNTSGTGWSDRTVIYEPYARYGSDTDYTGGGSLYKILSTNTTGEGDITFQHTGTMDINLIGNPPELNFEDTSSTTGLKRARWTLDSDNFKAEGLSDNDGSVTQELLRFPLSNGNGIFGNDVFVEGGQLYLGKPDVASGHLNAYEAMTFNIDGDNDDADTRYFRWYKNGNSGGGNQLMALTEGGLLGIGTNPSSFRLHVEAAVGGNAFKVTRGAGTQFRLFQSGDGTTHMGTSGTNGHFIFRTGTTVGSDDEKLRITKDGLVLIGSGLSSTGINGGDLRVTSKVDINNTDTGAFRIYNGSTFRGGLGTGQWASGNTANVNKMALYSTQDIQFYNNGSASPSGHFTLAKLIKTRASEATTGQLELRNEGGITNGNFDGVYFTQGSAGATPLASIRCAYLSNGYPDLKFYTRSGSAQESVKLTIKNNGKVGINNDDPTYMLDVKGPATEAEPYAVIRAQAATNFGGFLADAPTQSHIRFAIGGNVKWQWRTGTNVSGDLRAYSWDGGTDVFQLTTAGYLTLSNGMTLGGNLQMSGAQQIFTNTSTVRFNHNSNTTPVAFQMDKGGSYAGTTRSFGVLNLSRTNGSTANGNGSSLFFMLKADGDSLVEYAGITGVRETNTTGSLDFHSYQRNVQMRMDNSGNLTCAGNVTAYSDPSDRKLKDNIEIIPNAVEKVKALNGVTFNYKKDGNRSTGLIAQDVQEVLPEAVYESKDLDGNEFLALNYGNTVGLLVEAIKEQQQEIESLKQTIKEIKNGNY